MVIETEEMLFEPTDLYAERWAKWEQVNLKYHPEWKNLKNRVKESAVDRISGKRNVNVTQMQSS